MFNITSNPFEPTFIAFVLTASIPTISPQFGIQDLCGSLIDNNKIYLTETNATGDLFLGYMLIGAGTAGTGGGVGKFI